MSDTNPTRSRDARDALRERLRTITERGVTPVVASRGAVFGLSYADVVALLDVADEGEFLMAERDAVGPARHRTASSRRVGRVVRYGRVDLGRGEREEPKCWCAYFEGMSAYGVGAVSAVRSLAILGEGDDERRSKVLCGAKWAADHRSP